MWEKTPTKNLNNKRARSPYPQELLFPRRTCISETVNKCNASHLDNLIRNFHFLWEIEENGNTLV